MYLQEIFDQLSQGEFSQLCIGGNSPGVIDESNWSIVLGHVNLGLTSLFKRFNLKEGRVTVGLIPGKEEYRLHSQFSVLNTKQPLVQKYIYDTVDNRFTDDILKIEQVLTDSRCNLPLNVGLDKYSVFTPNSIMIRVPKEIVNKEPDIPELLRTDSLEVVYRANHPWIAPGLGYFDAGRYEVLLPVSHLQALLFFVASRVNNPIGMTEEFHAGNSYYAKYEGECQRLEIENLEVDKLSYRDSFSRNGWV